MRRRLMQKEQRLRKRGDFAMTYRKGRVYGNHLLVLRVAQHNGTPARFGFVAGKAVGGAVVRNRVKRRLRAIARNTSPAPGLNIIVGTRKSAASAPYHELEHAFSALMRRAGALAAAPPVKESP